jgi:hypothetical protein
MTLAIPYKNFQEVGSHIRNPPKSHYNDLFYRKFEGFVETRSFIPEEA